MRLDETRMIAQIRSQENIVIFTCTWDGLSCLEAAGQNRISLPVSVKVVRVSCLSRVHSGLILKALEMGADGVMLAGCESRSCHYGVEEELVDLNFKKAVSILNLLGMPAEKLSLVRLAHGDGAGFSRKVREFISRLYLDTEQF